VHRECQTKRNSFPNVSRLPPRGRDLRFARVAGRLPDGIGSVRHEPWACLSVMGSAPSPPAHSAAERPTWVVLAALAHDCRCGPAWSLLALPSWRKERNGWRHAPWGGLPAAGLLRGLLGRCLCRLALYDRPSFPDTFGVLADLTFANVPTSFWLGLISFFLVLRMIGLVSDQPGSLGQTLEEIS
jgi:hypothetical protein